MMKPFSMTNASSFMPLVQHFAACNAVRPSSTAELIHGVDMLVQLCHVVWLRS